MCYMKLDRDSMSGSLTLTNKPNYKAFKFSDNFQERRALKRDTKSNFAVRRQKGNAVVKDLPRLNNLTACREPEGKTPMDSDTPEMVAFFEEEQDYQFVKDIFMDKEVPLMNKCLVENCELDHRIFSCMFNSDDHESDNGTLEMVSSMSNELKLRIENVLINNVKHEDESDSIVCSDEEVGKVPRREEELANSMVPSAAEKAEDSSYSSEATSGSEVESVSINTINSEEKFPHQADFEITFKPQGEMSESLTASGQSFVHQHDQVPYAGSNSFRSNSSSASSHSFAFPILPSEWKGSPVRMVTERKQKREQKNWRMCFLCFICCKF